LAFEPVANGIGKECGCVALCGTLLRLKRAYGAGDVGRAAQVVLDQIAPRLPLEGFVGNGTGAA